ncbi:unnamed protein product [Cladocopium goreaui]|uniref:Macro domain-containing protein n=1 Tax=Cladocopium goreaui TaxID=2562237 RepID=A0A9P1G1U8_9DINO|nr:unnamed protein product [Cladocopium goreaui]
MEGAPRGRPGPSEPISSPPRDAPAGPAGPAVPEGREGWPWQFQLNARRPSSPMAQQLRALSGGRTNVVNATARASYESALMSAVRRQMDAFEEKWEKKFRGDDHYWLTRPAHTVGAQGAHGDGRLRQERRDFSATTLDRLFDRVNVLEAQQPRVEKRLAELDGKVKGLSDELQGQIRQVHLLDDRRWEWKQKIEEELAAKCQALQQQMQALVASSRSISLEEDSRQQRTWHSALEEGLSAAARERNAMQQEVHEGFVNVCERLAALEMKVPLEDFPTSESLALKGDASEDFATEVLSKRLEDLEKRFEEALQDNFEIHQRHAAQEEQIRTLRTRFENREEQLRDLGERVERSDWDVKLSQIRQAIQEHNQQRTLQSEKLELLTKRVEYQEQVVEDVRFASRPALEPPLGVMEPVAVEDFAAPSALAVLEDQMKVMTAEIKRLQEPQEDKLGLSSLIVQLKEISPKVIAHEKSIRRLEDGATSQAESKLANEVSQASASLVSVQERLERLEQANADSEQLSKLRQDLADELRDLRHRSEENLKELGSELTLRLAKLETIGRETWSSSETQVELEKPLDVTKGLDIEKRLDRIEAQGKAEEEKWLKFQQELQEHKQQMESRLEFLQAPSFEDQDIGKDLLKREGTWTLNGSHGPYAFEPRNGWLSVKDQRIGRFSCKRIQDKPLHWPSGDDFSNLKNLSIVSSEIMTELQRQENDGALFVLPSQLNGAEYPSPLHEDIVYDVEDYKYDNTGGPRGQLALHPAAAQFLLDNAQNAQRTGGLNAAAALDIKELEAINGYLKIQDTSDGATASSMVLQTLREKLHTLRPLIMDDLLAQGVTPDKRSLFEGRHRVGVVYASAVPVNAYLNQVVDPGSARKDGSERSLEFQTQVAELLAEQGRLFLVAQYYAALKYAAESTRLVGRNRTRRRVYLMPLGGGVFNNPWEIIGRSMAKALQMLDDDLLEMLDICALAWKGEPSEEFVGSIAWPQVQLVRQRLREVFCQLNSAYGAPVTVASPPEAPKLEVLKAQEELRAEVLGLKELRHQLEVAALKDEAEEVRGRYEAQEVQRKVKTLEAELAETKVQLTAWRNSTEEGSRARATATTAPRTSAASGRGATAQRRTRALRMRLRVGSAVQQEVEERLVTMREKMEAIRRKEPDRIGVGNAGASDLQGTVLWCDSDPEILRSCDVLRGSGMQVQAFQEPEALLQQYLRKPQEVLCIMTSMMQGNGRKERNAMNGYDLLEAMQRAAAARRLPPPLRVMISCTAEEVAARHAGADIVVLGNRIKAQNLVVTKLRKSMGLQAGYVGDKSC